MIVKNFTFEKKTKKNLYNKDFKILHLGFLNNNK